MGKICGRPGERSESPVAGTKEAAQADKPGIRTPTDPAPPQPASPDLHPGEPPASPPSPSLNRQRQRSRCLRRVPSSGRISAAVVQIRVSCVVRVQVDDGGCWPGLLVGRRPPAGRFRRSILVTSRCVHDRAAHGGRQPQAAGTPTPYSAATSSSDGSSALGNCSCLGLLPFRGVRAGPVADVQQAASSHQL